MCVCVWLHYGRRVAFWPAGSIESLVAACAGGCFPSAGPVPAVRRPLLAPVDRRKAWWRFGSETTATPLLIHLAFINDIADRPSPCLALFGMPVLVIGGNGLAVEQLKRHHVIYASACLLRLLKRRVPETCLVCHCLCLRGDVHPLVCLCASTMKTLKASLALSVSAFIRLFSAQSAAFPVVMDLGPCEIQFIFSQILSYFPPN